jgi:hypothetical protein
MLEDLTPPVAVRNCATRTVLESLSDKDAKILSDALNSVNVWPAETLSTALNKRGIQLSGKSITFHRRGGCSCLTI